MAHRTIAVLPLIDFHLFKYQVFSTAHNVGKDIAIQALRNEGSVAARALALGLSVYGQGKQPYVDRLRTALKNDPSEEARAILAIMPEERKVRASRKPKKR